MSVKAKTVKPIIEFKNVTQKYSNGTKALKRITFKVDPGEFVFIVGPSGAGKSTLIKLLLREVKVLSGDIKVCNYDLKRMPGFMIPHLRRKMGIVFQDYRLLDNFNVYDNIALAMHVVGERKSVINERVKNLLKLVNLEDKGHSFPRELSGGEKQRVAFARAIANKPKLLIADEPTGNIDPLLTIEMMDLLMKINKLGTTVVMVTHEKSLVDYYKQRVITISDGKLTSDREQGGMFDEA